MISGQKAAHLALKALGQPNAFDGTFQELASFYPETMMAAADTMMETAFAYDA